MDHASDFAFSEIADHLVAEVAEFALAAIPFIGVTFLLLKVFRYAKLFGLFQSEQDNCEALRRLRRQISSELLAFLDRIEDKAIDDVEINTNKLVVALMDNFARLQKESQERMRWAEKYCK